MIFLDRRPHRHHFGETSMIKRLLECQYSAHSLPETHILISLPTGNPPTCSPTPLPFLLLYFTMLLGPRDPNLLKTLGTCLVHLDNVSKHSIQYWGSHLYTFIRNHKDTQMYSHQLHEPLIVEAVTLRLQVQASDLVSNKSLSGSGSGFGLKGCPQVLH